MMVVNVVIRLSYLVMILLGFKFLSSVSIAEAPGLFAPVGVGGNLVLHAESRLPGGSLAGWWVQADPGTMMSDWAGPRRNNERRANHGSPRWHGGRGC